jgi:hypothetical protein
MQPLIVTDTSRQMIDTQSNIKKPLDARSVVSLYIWNSDNL